MPMLSGSIADRASMVPGLSFCAAVLAAICASAQAAVIDLTSENFDVLVDGGRGMPWFIKFYAPWCGHCKQLAPVWEKLSMRLNDEVHVAKVDCTKSRSLATDWKVDGYPSLKFIAGGKVYNYEGSRSLESMESWAKLGWKATAGEEVPADRRFFERLKGRVEDLLVQYALPLLLLFFAIFTCWMCSGPEVTEEDRAKRRAFEEKLAELEAKHMAKRQAAAEGEENKQADGDASAQGLDAGGDASAEAVKEDSTEKTMSEKKEE
mmetsp:Transcript_56437/g.103539  ORF Transcript_56437/g.103539 Transcript_56437/m.103539 type:complete len:264 (+) Transcript_56437:1-792(+)